MRSKPFGLLLVLFVIALLPLPVGASEKEPVPPGPDFLTGPNEGDPEDIAVAYLEEEADSFGLRGSDVGDLVITSSYTSAHNGVTHVNVNQRFDGLEVFGGHATVNIATDGSVVFVGENLVGALGVAASGEADTDAIEAVEAAADGLDLDEPANLRVLDADDGAARETVVSGGGISDDPIPARLGWQPTARGLRLAWQLVIDDSSDDHLWNATVDAETGELLEVDDWTSQDSIEDLASTLARPSSASASVRAAASIAFAALSSPNAAIDGSSYRVFALPKGDPNDGPRTLLTNPADAVASPWGWHDLDGADGAESTLTLGNNAHAYTDRDANNQPDPGSEPDGGPGLTFDFPADLNEHPQTYLDASVTNLFYWCNTIHDVTYRYGFDEASGNFQVNNYGRGGVGGDDVRCEGQDGSGQNNANFSTPAADGGRPRMQMFLWPGAQFGMPNAVTVGSATYPAQYARFTPAPTNAGFAGTLVVVDDGTAPTGDGCEPYPAPLPAGSIAVVDRTSECNYYVQVTNAGAAGAIAVVVVNNVDSAPVVMAGSMDPPVGIPAVMVSQADGDAIKAGSPTAGVVHRNQDRPPMRDSDFRSETIVHEYGHGVSNRLTGGPGINCLSGNEQMGEGWSDFLAIAMLLDPNIDDPQLPRGYGQYALFNDGRVGPGFRAAPYSRNMNHQPFTYDMIKTNGWITGGSLAIPHGIGHAWAAVLWDMTWDLVDRHGFNPDVFADWSTGGNNLAIQLVMDGLKMQGCGPGFVVGRDAIIAADTVLTGGENRCLLWRTFARRGLGFSAVQGTTNRDDNDEAFDLPADCVRNQTRVDLLGEYEVGGGDPDGTGGARLSWNQAGKVCFDIRVSGVAPITAAHIHSGGHGVDGDIVVDFDVAANGLQGCVSGVDTALLQQIRTSPSQYYLNVHNSEYPAGALRGQLS